jgi:hypothetical protein
MHRNLCGNALVARLMDSDFTIENSWLGGATRRPPLLDAESPSSNFGPTNHVQQLLQLSWSGVINDYSERKLSNINDKPIAITAIARQVSTTAFKDYLCKAGPWFPNSPDQNSFLHDLCWTTKLPLPSQEQSVYLAPSWSWASSHISTSSLVSAWEIGALTVNIWYTRQIERLVTTLLDYSSAQ